MKVEHYDSIATILTTCNLMLYHKRAKSVIKWVWGFFALLIAISMIFAYSGGAGALGGGSSHQQIAPAAQQTIPATELPTEIEIHEETITIPTPDRTEPEVPFEISL